MHGVKQLVVPFTECQYVETVIRETFINQGVYSRKSSAVPVDEATLLIQTV